MSDTTPHRKQSTGELFRTAPEHARASWAKLAFECQARASIPESDLPLLQWTTLRDLAHHLGISDPAEVAKIELVWLAKQGEVKQQQERQQEQSRARLPSSSMGRPSANTRRSPSPTTSSRAPPMRFGSSVAPSKAVSAAAPPRTAVTPIRRQPSAAAGASTATPTNRNNSNSRGTSPGASSVASSTAAARARRAGGSATTTTPIRHANNNNSKSISVTTPSRRHATTPNSRSASAATTTASGNSGASTPPRRRDSNVDEALARAVCIEDMKPIFVAYASYGEDGSVDKMDVARFVFLCRSCDLFDRQFRARDAEGIFHAIANRRGSSSNTKPVLYYHQFRMKLIPEMASKRRCSILDIVRQCIRIGGPRAANQARQRKIDRDEDEQAEQQQQAAQPQHAPHDLQRTSKPSSRSSSRGRPAARASQHDDADELGL